MIVSTVLHLYREAYLAVTDFVFYRSIFEQSARRSILYLVFIAAHLSIFLSLLFAWQLGPELNALSLWAQENFPVLEVEGGTLSIEAEQPLIRKYPGREPVTFVFDTTGTHTDPGQLEEPAVLFTQDRFLLRSFGQTQTYFWRDMGSFRLGPQEISDVTVVFKSLYFPLSLAFFFFYNLVSKSLLASCLTLIGISAAARYGIRLPFQQHFTIALYALTPAIVIDSAVQSTGLEISFSPLIYLFTAAIWTYMGTLKCVVVE